MPPSTPDVLVRPDVAARPAVRVRGVPTAIGIGSAAVLGLMWGSPLMGVMVRDGDFPFHLQAAAEFAATGVVTVPHFLLQVLLGGTLALGIFASVPEAALVFFASLYAVTAAVTCWYIGRGATGTMGIVASVALAMGVLLSAPIFPSAEPSVYLIGYFPANAYHNPTMLMAKPLLVLSFASTVAALTRVGNVSLRETLLLILPVVLLGLAKPNYLGCLLPVLAVAAARYAVQRETVSWQRVAAVSGAAILTLASTFLLYQSEELRMKGSVVLAPFGVIARFAPVDPSSIAEYLFRSLAFPIIVTMLWPLAVLRDVPMRIAWAATAIGLFISYFLAEGGQRFDHGNFLWTGQMAAFILFVAAAGFARSRLQWRSDSAVMFGRALALGVALVFHVESGLRHAFLKLDPAQWLTFWT
jgi:hypothetical protein